MSSEAVSPGPQVTAEWIPLGQRLLERGLVSGQELERALDLQRRLGGRLGGILVRSGAISENTLMQVLAEQLRLPLVGDDLRKPSEESIAAFLLSTPINTDWFVEEQLVVWEEGEQLLFAARDPLSPSIRETLGYFYPERSIQAVLCRSQDLDGWLEHSLDLARQGADRHAYGSEDIRYLRELAEEAPVVELVNNVMSQAMEKRSSDIHIEPREFDFRIRFRVDGVLHDQLSLPRERFAAVVSRIKLISAIDIAERRLPQDGRMSNPGQRYGARRAGLHLARGAWRIGGHAPVAEGARGVAPGPARDAPGPLAEDACMGSGTPRHHPGDRPHRIGQVHHALWRAGGNQ